MKHPGRSVSYENLNAGVEQETKGDAGPIVNDQDIANIVSQWTGIPIEKVQLHIATYCGFAHCPQGFLHDAQYRLVRCMHSCASATISYLEHARLAST